MKHIQKYGLWAVLCVGCALQVRAVEETYQIDPVHSTVAFKVRHLGISWVTGSFKDFAGKVVLDPEAPEKASIEVTAQAASVDTGSEKRDKHLRSPDFFDVEKHATRSFKSSKIEKMGEDAYRVTGDFTLMGETKPVTFEMSAAGPVEAMGKIRRGGETAFTIKRSEYGMDKMAGPVGDEVKITLAFSAVKQ